MNIFKRVLSVTLGSLVLLGSITPLAQAGDLILGGQRHEYKVVMRGDGRAIVVGKLTIPNTNDEALSTVNVGLSVDDATQMTAYQLVVDQGCAAWESETDGDLIMQRCASYKDITSRDLSNAEYEKISSIVDVNNSSYTLTLPSPVEPNASTVIVFAYSSKQYASHFLGLYSYDFKTPTVDDRIEYMSVTVQTDSDLYLKGEDTTIHYDDNISGGEFAEASALSADMALTTISSNRGNVVRTSATDLFPGESYEVTGKYSEHWWRLHLCGIITFLLIVAAMIGFGVWRHKKMPKGQNTDHALNKVKIPVAMTDSPIFMGFFSALMIGVWTVIAMNLLEGNLIGRLHNDTAEILAALVVFMIYVLIGLGPSVSIGHRKGWNAGVMAFISAIVWLIIGIALFNSADIDPVIEPFYD